MKQEKMNTHMNYCIRSTTQLKKDSTELVNFCLNYFTLEAGESRFTEVAFSSCCDSWPVCCAGGGGGGSAGEGVGEHILSH